MMEWENGEITTEPLSIIATDDPVACALYAKENGLLNTDGWKHFKQIAKREQQLTRMMNQAKLCSFNHSPKYKYGFEVPQNYLHIVELDLKYGSTKWCEAVKLELAQLDEYDVFHDKGHKDDIQSIMKRLLENYKKIRVYLVFDVKRDGRQKA